MKSGKLSFNVAGYWSSKYPKRVGYAFVGSDGHTGYGLIEESEFLGQRTVAGELEAVMRAIEYALSKGVKFVEIKYTFVGVERFINGSWKAKSFCAAAYKEWMADVIVQNNLTVKFKHVGPSGNASATALARKAVLTGKTSGVVAKRAVSVNTSAAVAHSSATPGTSPKDTFPIPSCDDPPFDIDDDGSSCYDPFADAVSSESEVVNRDGGGDIGNSDRDSTPDPESDTGHGEDEGYECECYEEEVCDEYEADVDSEIDVSDDADGADDVLDVIEDDVEDDDVVTMFLVNGKYGLEFMIRPVVSYTKNMKYAAATLAPLIMKLNFTVADEVERGVRIKAKYSTRLSVLTNLVISHLTKSWVIISLNGSDFFNKNGIFNGIFNYHDMRDIVYLLKDKGYIKMKKGYYRKDGTGRMTMIRPTMKFLRELLSIDPNLLRFVVFDKDSRKLLLQSLQDYVFKVESWRCYGSLPLSLKRISFGKDAKGRRVRRKTTLSEAETLLIYKTDAPKRVKEQVKMLEEINQFFQDAAVPVSIKNAGGIHLYKHLVDNIVKATKQRNKRRAYRYLNRLINTILSWSLRKNDMVLARRAVHYVASYQTDIKNSHCGDWLRLGRIYDHGLIQNLPSHIRCMLTLYEDDISNVVELDYKAMQPSILYVLLTNNNESIINRDFYHIPGYDRKLIKYATLIMINASSSRAAVQAVRKFLVSNGVEKGDEKLKLAYIKHIFNLIVTKNPFLKPVKFSGVGKIVQHIDGIIATKVLHKMTVQLGVPTYAIHDSFVTHFNFDDRLRNCMEEMWVETLVQFISKVLPSSALDVKRELPPEVLNNCDRFRDVKNSPIPLPIITSSEDA